MIIEEQRIGDAFVFQHAMSRNLLLGEKESESEVFLEWACFETWSTGPDARARARQRRSATSRRHRT